MITDIAGGEVTSDIVDIYPKKIADHQVVLNFENTTLLIGEELPKETIKEILTSLEIKVNNVTESGLGMTIPAYRNDVTREADVIEEILRVYGYNRIRFSEKLNASISKTKKVEDHLLQQQISAQLTALGFNEMLANSLTSPTYGKLSEQLKEEHNVEILNPLSQELSILRPSMLFGGMEALSYNSNRKMKDVKLFEFGCTYHNYPDGRQEQKHLSLVVSGERIEESWTAPVKKSDFFYFKGVVAAVLERLGLTDYAEKASKSDIFTEGLTFTRAKQDLVTFGIINKKVRNHFDLDAEVLYADFNWGILLEQVSADNFVFKAIPKYPSVKRDFALLLDDDVAFGELKEAALQTEKNLLKEVSLFDVYTGKNLPKGKKSYALSFTLQDERKTLTDKQIDKIMAKLQQRFENDFGAQLR
jgi:phenylalanyl-tRNA synthetase beta chain